MSNEPPWEEWSDYYLNTEQWTDASFSRGIVKFYADPIGRCSLPPSLSEACVGNKRLEGNLLVNIEEEPDLFTEENEHLLCSDAMKHIMAGLCNLAQAGQVSMEINGDNYYQNTSTTWRPWHHMYSHCQAGKGTHHAPQVNRTGKYIIRLYYLGAWRRIYVDDMVPVNAKGKCLLPTCSRKLGINGPYVQLLWPPLISKAILRIASLTWSRKNELYGWNAYTCLTGWQQLKLECSKLQPAFTWRLCLKLLGQARKHTHTPMKDFHSDGSGDGSGYADTTLHTCASMLLLALCGTESTPIIVTQTLVFSGANIETGPPKLARWKHYRWKEWATNNGTYEEYRIHMDRILKFYYPLGRKANLPQLAPRTVTLLEEIPKLLPRRSVSYMQRSTANIKKTKLPQKKFVDPTEWLDFKEIFPLIKHIEIFFKPSAFLCTEHVQDFLKNIGLPESYMASTLKRSTMKNLPIFRPKMELSWLQEPEPNFFLVIDSAAPKHIFISLSILPECSTKNSRTSILPGEDISDADFKRKISLVGSLVCWKDRHLQEPLFTIKTGGSVSKIVALPAGKCLLRLWCYIPVKHLSIIFASQTKFSLCTKADAHEEISVPGIALERRSLELVKRLKAVLNWQFSKTRSKFNVLQDLYRALLPDSSHPEKIRAKLYEVLMTIASRAPDFRSDPDYMDIVSDVKSILRSKTYSTVLILEEQKLLKRILKKQLWLSSSQSVVGKQLTLNVSEQSTKLARSSIFPVAKRDIRFREFKQSFISETVDENLKFGVTILKLIFAGSDLCKRYPLMYDIDNLACFKDIYGTSDLAIEHDWVPITKYVLNHTKSSDEVTCLISFTTRLKIWNMTIVNNETLCEVTKVIKHFVPIKFTNGQSYTIFVYAWLPGLFFSSPVTISWKLRLFASEYDQIPHGCHSHSGLHCSETGPRKLVQKEVKGGYLPNSRSIIFRTIFRCEKSTTDFAIRVCMSNPFAKFMLTIKYMDEVVISTHKAIGEIIIPVLKQLKDGNKLYNTDEVFYTIEGILLDNSWILTEDEIEAAIAFKNISISSFKESTTTKAKSSNRFSIARLRATKTAISVASLNTIRSTSESSSFLLHNRVPLWSVSVVVDKGSSFTFTIDRRLEEKLEAMKLSWELEQPGRTELGKQLRDEFILKRKSEDEPLETQLPPSEQFTVLTEQKVHLDKCIRDDSIRNFSEQHAQNLKEMANAMLITQRFDAIITNTLQYMRLQNLAKVDQWMHHRRTITLIKKKVKIKKRK